MKIPRAWGWRFRFNNVWGQSRPPQKKGTQETLREGNILILDLRTGQKSTERSLLREECDDLSKG